MRKALCASVLTMALTFSAYAGEMQNGITSNPPSSQETVAGEMQNGITSTSTESTAIEVLLELLVVLVP